ncbi:M23 family metallopeptidase [Sphingomonas montanisoli]|uniref:M23 family metallopeptidase n=1 Tax=Sphingomonas montanisoli TaxID=2606412 RepID=A0A5D9CG64_9SPHN|nr:M23 family metallopeptidase [Sphingomonas montanisoli]TZG29151.1 M23 family metallopeptidase [Sphingomonas montanisoli]
MFQGSRQQGYAEDFGQGGGATGALVLAKANRFRPIGRIADSEWAARVGDRFATTDIVVDLGVRIGSRAWWRGLATCIGLCTAAALFTPGFKPLPVQYGRPLAGAEWEEARSLSIAPLGLGADSGRRLAPTEAVEPLADTPERPRVEMSATIGQGDGFARVLERAGVSKDEARQVSNLVSGAVPLGDLRSGTRMVLVLGRRARKSDPRPLETLGFRAKFDLKLAIERAEGGLRLKRIPIAVDDTPLRIQGRVGSSLFAAARSAGMPSDAIQAFIRAVAVKMPMRQIGSDARFDAIIEHRRAETGETQTGQLLYAGVTQGGRKTQMLRWSAGGRDKWYDAAGTGETRGAMSRPVQGYMTSSFGMRRHPILGFSRMHQGMDFGAPMGAPIVAATDGVVAFAGRHGGHGNYVRLNHSGGIATGYAHMSRIIARQGERVRQGQLIGYVGSTGMSTGPHLHYEVYRGGKPVNPATMSFTVTDQLGGADLARFKAKLSNLLAVRITAAEPRIEKKADKQADAATAKKSDKSATRKS